ncbi:MAG: flagellinolysin [Acetobacterium woodii]|nr:flagellinolysin [Acetobacterium woodii]
MRINHNIAALNTYQKLNQNNGLASKALEKLSSGQSINRAGDNAAGLAISEKMRGQIRGLDQAGANAKDAISLIQTAEGALGETHSLVQRMRELSVQAANDTNTTDDRGEIQKEIDQLVAEVDRIGNNTEFNTKKLLNQGNASVNAADQQNLMSSLKKWWLDEAENLVSASYGDLWGATPKVDLTVEFFNDASDQTAASVGGTATDMTLRINLAYAQPTDTQDGGTAPQYVDRVIAHEMTHAVMMATTNMSALPTWFIEGVAEFTHGGDERLESAMASLGSITGVVANFGTGVASDWDGSSDDYGSAYLAVRYMDRQIKGAGGAGVQDVLQYLATHAGSTLDDALGSVNTFAIFLDAAQFATHFSLAVNDASYGGLTNILLDAGAETDTGAAIGLDANGGAAKNAEDIMPESAGPGAPEMDQPMSHFNIIWPDLSASAAQSFSIQVGANTGQTMDIQTSDMRASALGLSGLKVDSRTAADAAISTCDTAIGQVSAERSRLGAYQNRLEHSIKNLETASENLTSSESRIRDVDMAKEMMQFTKTNILSQAAQSMLAQANQQPQNILKLLA